MAIRRKKSKAKVRLALFVPICLCAIVAIVMSVGSYWVEINSKYQEKAKLDDVRDETPLKYDEAKNMLNQLIFQEEMVKLMDRLTKQAKVEKFNEDGTPATDTPAIPASAAAPAA